MKKIILLSFLFVTICCLLVVFSLGKSCDTEQIVEAQEETNVKELSIIHMNKEMEAIEHLKNENNFEWYKAYRNIICKYKHVIDEPLTIFNFYTEEEIKLICKTVETECHGNNFDSKCNVASVIINRIEDPDKRFGETVKDVITQPNQFTYWRETISEDTLYAVMFCFEIQDTTNGCLSFHSNKKTEKFGGRNYVFTDDAKHHFYR